MNHDTRVSGVVLSLHHQAADGTLDVRGGIRKRGSRPQLAQYSSDLLVQIITRDRLTKFAKLPAVEPEAMACSTQVKLALTEVHEVAGSVTSGTSHRFMRSTDQFAPLVESAVWTDSARRRYRLRTTGTQ